jgi:hypothetical protein
LIQEFAGMKFIAAANTFFSATVPISDEDKLAPCQYRVVIDEATRN